MRRPVLLTLAAVGGVIVLLGGTGIFAALSDTARSGTNSVDSDALPPSSDLQVAMWGVPTICGPFGDDLTSSPIIVSGPPGSGSGDYLYCLRNVGSHSVHLSMSLEELEETETGCTGDENIFDTTCGSGPGELGDFVSVNHQYFSSCFDDAPSGGEIILVRAHQTTPASLGTLLPGETRCFSAQIVGYLATPTQLQQAQSDRLTWRFAWTGQV